MEERKLENGLSLIRTEAGLTLAGDELEVRGDFGKMIPRIKKLQHETLVKAVKIKGIERSLSVIDATAGLGEDSIILAASGCNVRMYEYNPVIADLLEDALARAMEDPELSGIASRMTLVKGDSIESLKNLDEAPDVVLLDPMFPARQKSALVKKKFQLLQQLEVPCNDEKELLDAALAAKPFKVVIKRPAKGPYLAGVKPSYSIQGKAIRYDCIVLPENKKHDL